jgi:hypothetical protein
MVKNLLVTLLYGLSTTKINFLMLLVNNVFIVTILAMIVKEIVISVQHAMVVSSFLKTLVLNVYLVVSNAKMIQHAPYVKMVST